jgi:hypothetical protein
MNKMTIAAIAVAAVLLVAGAYVVISMGNNPNNGGNDGGNTNTQTDAVDSKNKTLAVSFPVTITSDNRKMALSMTYPGKGESGYTYDWSQDYQFSLTASPASGYTGNVLIKMFDEKSGEIGQDSLKVKDFQGNQITWTFSKKNNSEPLQNMLSGDIVSWKTNGTESTRTFDVTFTATGNFTLIIQAFDLDTGKAISDPVKASPLYVPTGGHLTIGALFHGEWYQTENGTYYRVLVNATNNWNVRYYVDPARFYISNGSEPTVWVKANTTTTTFQNQSLAPGQTTQFFVYFDISGNRLNYELKYEDLASGTILVPLPPVTS